MLSSRLASESFLSILFCAVSFPQRRGSGSRLPGRRARALCAALAIRTRRGRLRIGGERRRDTLAVADSHGKKTGPARVRL